MTKPRKWWKAERLPTKIWNKTRMSTLTTSLQHRIGSASHSNQTRKRKVNYIGWKEVKLSLYTDDTILYIEKPKDSTQKLLKLVVNKFTKVAGQKLTYRNQLHFFILIMKYQKWNVNNLFKITSKILVINLTKEVKDIYWEL